MVTQFGMRRHDAAFSDAFPQRRRVVLERRHVCAFKGSEKAISLPDQTKSTAWSLITRTPNQLLPVVPITTITITVIAVTVIAVTVIAVTVIAMAVIAVTVIAVAVVTVTVVTVTMVAITRGFGGRHVTIIIILGIAGWRLAVLGIFANTIHVPRNICITVWRVIPDMPGSGIELAACRDLGAARPAAVLNFDFSTETGNAPVRLYQILGATNGSHAAGRGDVELRGFGQFVLGANDAARFQLEPGIRDNLFTGRLGIQFHHPKFGFRRQTEHGAADG